MLHASGKWKRNPREVRPHKYCYAEKKGNLADIQMTTKWAHTHTNKKDHGEILLGFLCHFVKATRIFYCPRSRKGLPETLFFGGHFYVLRFGVMVMTVAIWLWLVWKQMNMNVYLWCRGSNELVWHPLKGKPHHITQIVHNNNMELERWWNHSVALFSA